MHPAMRKLAVLALLPLLGAATEPRGALEVDLTGVRNTRGVIHACLTREPNGFPKCERDPDALTATVPASAGSLQFAGFAPGTYAVTLFHDENENDKLDTFAGIPREGFGFSRNPAIRFGAPRFRQAELTLGAGTTRQSIRVRYLL